MVFTVERADFWVLSAEHKSWDLPPLRGKEKKFLAKIVAKVLIDLEWLIALFFTQ